MPTAWPDRNQKAPDYWDLQLKSWIEESPSVPGAFRDALDARILLKAPATDISGKADLVSGKVPASQLPSYVDDVLEFATVSAFPATGEAGKIYVVTSGTDINKQYRWGGSSYILLSTGSATVSADNVTDGTTNKTYTAVEKTKLAGIATGATANVKATSSQVQTGTDDTTFVTPLNAVARPVTGVTLVQQFVYTDATVARPSVPSYVSLNWVGPAGSGGVAPTNMTTSDTWDMQS